MKNPAESLAKCAATFLLHIENQQALCYNYYIKYKGGAIKNE